MQGGGLVFEDGGTITGPMTADSGDYLQFDGGTFNLDSSSTISGAGTVYFTGAIVNDSGSYGAAAGTVVSGGTANLTGTITELGDVLTISGGTLNLATGQSFTIPALTMSGGTLTGFPSLTVTGSTDWTGGTITGGGTFTTQGSLTLGDPNSGVRHRAARRALAPSSTKAPATMATLNGGYYGLCPLQRRPRSTIQSGAQASTFPYRTRASNLFRRAPARPSRTTVPLTISRATDGSLIYAIFDESATGTTLVQGGTFQIIGDSTFAGTIEAMGGGAVVMTTVPTNLSGGTLTGATWIVDANSSMSLGADITTDAATVVLKGTGADFSSLSPLSQIAAGGDLTILDGGSFTTAGDLDNAGTIDLSPGTLTVAGNYTQESSGRYDVGVGGLAAGGGLGQLVVSGLATLDGTLSVGPDQWIYATAWRQLSGHHVRLGER